MEVSEGAGEVEGDVGELTMASIRVEEKRRGRIDDGRSSGRSFHGGRPCSFDSGLGKALPGLGKRAEVVDEAGRP